MNPSAIGWIKKLLTILPNSTVISLSNEDFYRKLKASGFIYGSNVSSICQSINDTDFNEEERCKVNLVTAFYYIHSTEKSSLDFLESVNAYYKITDEHKQSFLLDLFGEPSSDRLLEKIIHKHHQAFDLMADALFALDAGNVKLAEKILSSIE